LEFKKLRLWTMAQQVVHEKGVHTRLGTFELATQCLSSETCFIHSWKNNTPALLCLNEKTAKSPEYRKDFTNLFIFAWEKHVPKETREKQSIGEYYLTLHKVLSSNEIPGYTWYEPCAHLENDQTEYENIITEICNYLGITLWRS